MKEDYFARTRTDYNTHTTVCLHTKKKKQVMNLPLSLNATSREGKKKKKDPHTYNGDFSSCRNDAKKSVQYLNTVFTEINTLSCFGLKEFYLAYLALKFQSCIQSVHI